MFRFATPKRLKPLQRRGFQYARENSHLPLAAGPILPIRSHTDPVTSGDVESIQYA